MFLFIIFSSAALITAFPGGDHQGDGHEDDCVDISKYSEVLYEENDYDICTYRTSRSCHTRQNTACVGIPETTCEAVAYADCTSVPFTGNYHDDRVLSKTFVGKECFQSGTQTLTEYHKVPVCQNVTKEQCDSKWVINEAGEKVWDGNENCQEVTWEDCHLESHPTPLDVPTYTCIDKDAITYSVPEFQEVEVTGYKSSCRAAAYAKCSTTTVQKCKDLEYEECTDFIEPICFGHTFFRVPYQTYDHRLKCIVN